MKIEPSFRDGEVSRSPFGVITGAVVWLHPEGGATYGVQSHGADGSWAHFFEGRSLEEVSVWLSAVGLRPCLTLVYN